MFYFVAQLNRTLIWAKISSTTMLDTLKMHRTEGDLPYMMVGNAVGGED